MIYLNKTCFNGLYRVNKSGGFNVPFGSYKNPTICDEENLRACSAALAPAVIRASGFWVTVADVERGDFVYFDPPYVPVSKTSNFAAYTAAGFGPKDQERLRNLALSLKRRGVHVLISNSGTEAVRELYSDKDFLIEEVQARRSINSKGKGRGAVKEYLIR